MTGAATPRRGRRPYVKGGYYRTKARLMRGGLAVVDGRTQTGRALVQDRADLVAHVGGEPSATQSRVVDAVLTLDLLIGAGVAALREHGPVDRRRHAYRPVARELAGLIEKRHRMLADLGWARAPKPAESIREILARHEREAQERAREAQAGAASTEAPVVRPGGAQEAE